LTESAGDIIPNDIEYLVGTLSGDKEDTSDHQIIFSTGYVNMLKNGKYFIGNTADDGTEISYGTNASAGASPSRSAAPRRKSPLRKPSRRKPPPGAAERERKHEAESEPEVPPSIL
jgi:hypothetical protein